MGFCGYGVNGGKSHGVNVGKTCVYGVNVGKSCVYGVNVGKSHAVNVGKTCVYGVNVGKAFREKRYRFHENYHDFRNKSGHVPEIMLPPRDMPWEGTWRSHLRGGLGGQRPPSFWVVGGLAKPFESAAPGFAGSRVLRIWHKNCLPPYPPAAHRLPHRRRPLPV